MQRALTTPTRMSPDTAWPIRLADGSTPSSIRREYRPKVEPRRALLPMQQPRRSLFDWLRGKA